MSFVSPEAKTLDNIFNLEVTGRQIPTECEKKFPNTNRALTVKIITEGFASLSCSRCIQRLDK